MRLTRLGARLRQAACAREGAAIFKTTRGPASDGAAEHNCRGAPLGCWDMGTE